MAIEQKKLLYLVHRIPYPPNKGDKIRSFNILKFLARHDYQIYLGTFVDDPDDWQYLDALEEYCEEVYAAPLKRLQSKLRSLSALLSGSPMTVPYYKDTGLKAWIKAQTRQHDFDAVLVFSSAMAQYVMDAAWADKRRVIDFVDVDSDKWQQYANTKSWPMNWVYRREAACLLSYDRRVATEFDASFFVSAEEASLFRRISDLGENKVSHADNGVDIEYFSPHETHESPYSDNELVIVFTGAMDYWANEDAVAWFAQQVMPLILKRLPMACFYIVGARPSRRVLQLAGLPHVEVTGAVHDIRPYLANARVAVAPMRIARGVQNKVLEAMAMARPVVVTQPGVDGILPEARQDLVVEDSEQGFADAVCRLIEDQSRAQQLGRSARQKIEAHYSWDSSLQCLIPLLDSVLPDAVRQEVING